MPLDENKPVDRRRFFRLGLSELLRPLASAVQPFERAMNELGNLDKPPATRAKPQVPADVWLRPPGALSEEAFKSTCSRCGECVRVCPAHAIQIDASGARGNGVPFIDADNAACVVCSGLQCMSVCPTGAIRPTSINEIDMGTAVWKPQHCLRSNAEQCTICVDRCPLGSAAIEIKNGNVAVKPLGCIGCGVCQKECPTSPKSIVVIPIAAKTAGRY